MARRGRILRYFTYALLLAIAAFGVFALTLDVRVRSEFEGRRFALPARIYARPLELHAGLRIAQADIEDELRELGYRDSAVGETGWFKRSGSELEISLRPFVFWDGAQPARRVRALFDGARVAAVQDAAGKELPLARLEPVPIGGIYPAGNEDRILVRLPDVPKHLVDELIATEDRKFYTHLGFDPRALVRAAASIATGRLQGGSTITQQLVKNFFLTPERTLRRKFTELVMAILLEAHYGKAEILETYLNEIYLGQDRDRALARRIAQYGKERRFGQPGLEGAVVITDPSSGEVQALVGGKDARYRGYNRALDAARPIGSLLKPAVYLTALSQPSRYTLITLLDDGPFVWKSRGAPDWEPQNYDRKFHGRVPLRVALAQSYNAATARLGTEIGVEKVLDTVKKLGVERELRPFAATLRGAAEMSPLG